MTGWYSLQVINSELPDTYPVWSVYEQGGDGGSWDLGPAEVPRNECEPSCTDRECGTDYCGGSCGECSGELVCDNAKGICKGEYVGSEDPGGSGSGGGDSYCDTCLQTCEGLDSCCTGKGCICEDDCAPTGCSPGTFLCCGYDGTCLCLEDCPYS